MNNPSKSIIKHVLSLSCPSCGKTRLFASYLKQVNTCAECGVAWGKYKADDGPAWLTIVILGHILIPVAVGLAMETEWSSLNIVGGVCIAAILLVMLLLPFSKAVFLATLWRSNAGIHATEIEKND
jgi:uncharacterized protein (DUF983 family)